MSDEPANALEWFGQELAAALEHKRATQQELADFTGYKPPYVSKVKTGQAMPSLNFAEGCDRFFNTSGSFARLHQRLSQQGYPSWFVPYIQYENRAASILDYSPGLIMGALQTEAYATAVFRSSGPRDSVEAIRDKVARRLKRREALDREDPPLLWCVLDESCLRRTVGGLATMREQLGSLLKDAESPHITLQVLPYSSGAPSTHLAFTLLEFSDEPTVLYVETPLSGQVVDSASVVAESGVTYDRLRADALSPEASLYRIRTLMEELPDEQHP
ncbi:helix-turn-helix domain-containing protein [Streptomyces sp. NPDC058420]|uniref:helix-turn-helix domain-containing protein n=1 Tax=Streptomyces sp. NPDC058420 TaxID=3346489 RepID=UPI00365C6C6A